MVAISPVARRRRENAHVKVVPLQELARLTPDLLPGVEGMAADQVLRDDGRRAQQRHVASPQRLACQYPELAAQLSALFGH